MILKFLCRIYLLTHIGVYLYFLQSKLVYANYGCKEDFSRLKKLNVSVEKNVILIKYGKTHPANKVSNDEHN